MIYIRRDIMVNDRDILDKILREIDNMSAEEVVELERKAVIFIERLEDIYRNEYVLDVNSEFCLNISNNVVVFETDEQFCYKTISESISFDGEKIECQAA